MLPHLRELFGPLPAYGKEDERIRAGKACDIKSVIAGRRLNCPQEVRWLFHCMNAEYLNGNRFLKPLILSPRVSCN